MSWKSGDEAITLIDREHVRLIRRRKRATDDGYNWTVRIAHPRPNHGPDTVPFDVYEGNLLTVGKLTPPESLILSVFGGWLAAQAPTDEAAQGIADLINRFEEELSEDWRELAAGTEND